MLVTRFGWSSLDANRWVLVDSLGAFKLHEAISVGRKLDELGNIGWFEDALMPEDTASYPKLVEALDTAVCVGETLCNRFQFRDLFPSEGRTWSIRT